MGISLYYYFAQLTVITISERTESWQTLTVHSICQYGSLTYEATGAALGDALCAFLSSALRNNKL